MSCPIFSKRRGSTVAEDSDIGIRLRTNRIRTGLGGLAMVFLVLGWGGDCGFLLPVLFLLVVWVGPSPQVPDLEFLPLGSWVPVSTPCAAEVLVRLLLVFLK